MPQVQGVQGPCIHLALHDPQGPAEAVLGLGAKIGASLDDLGVGVMVVEFRSRVRNTLNDKVRCDMRHNLGVLQFLGGLRSEQDHL